MTPTRIGLIGCTVPAELEEPDFHIDEEASDAAREAFLRDHLEEAAEIEDKEAKRRARKAKAAAAEVDADTVGTDTDDEAQTHFDLEGVPT